LSVPQPQVQIEFAARCSVSGGWRLLQLSLQTDPCWWFFFTCCRALAPSGFITCFGIGKNVLSWRRYTQFGYTRVGAWIDMITHILMSLLALRIHLRWTSFSFVCFLKYSNRKSLSSWCFYLSKTW
jgi:hypothetical protein